MSVRAVHIKGYRSILSTALRACGPLNVLVGRNNAGKSNILAAFDLLFEHISHGTVARRWRGERPLDELNERDADMVAQVGMELDLPTKLNRQLAENVAGETEHLERLAGQFAAFSTVSFVLSYTVRPKPFIWTQQIGLGPIAETKRGELGVDGALLLSVPREVGTELFLIQESADQLRNDLGVLESVKNQIPEMEYMFRSREDIPPRSYFVERFLGRSRSRGSQATMQAIDSLLRTATQQEDFESGIGQLLDKTTEAIRVAQERQTEGSFTTLSGSAKVPPPYVSWLMRHFGEEPYLHLPENKRPITREDAQALLNLKITRGGPARLALLQETIRALLGVNIDAFAPEGRGDRSAHLPAEMDVDDFLVEANGAGVRQALRIILDLELRAPALALIEEPEVHLHPAMERALEGYLREKSKDIQLFITTHSTNFVDAAAVQNVYVVGRDGADRTVCTEVSATDAVFRISSELGLRLSSVFMFDSLAFVEGPSDEATLRAIARTLGVELATSSVGFIHMGGVRNFAHYATEHTLDLLSRRQVRMMFIVDRDESCDADVEAMMRRLGDRAVLKVLKHRELENYLLCPEALAPLLRAKGGSASGLEPEQVVDSLRRVADSLRAEVVRRRLERRILRPIHLIRRDLDGDAEERLRNAIAELEERLAKIEDVRSQLQAEVDQEWGSRWMSIVPGTLLLETVFQQHGLSFDKAGGDAARLASLVPKDKVDPELRRILGELAGEPS